MADEQIDFFDINNQYLTSGMKSEAHREGIWHRTFHCWIISRRGANKIPCLVFQKRSDNKEFLPGLYDISAAGHLAAGEKAVQGVREIEEELGVKISEADLISSGYRVDALKQGKFINKEFPEVFYLFDDRMLTEYSLQKDELSGLIEMPVDDCLKLFSSQVESVEVDFVDTNKNFSQISVTKQDFVERVDNYFLKTAIMAERLLDGKPVAA